MENNFLEQEQMDKLYESEFVAFYKLKESSLGVCMANTEYIPIEHFRKDFHAIGKLIKENEIHALVFDKQKLNTFHQPSMEWYYTQWKEELVGHGLKTHYKILPSAPWFEKSVEAGKRDIKKNNPDFDFDQFEVKYVASLADAIDHWKGLN